MSADLPFVDFYLFLLSRMPRSPPAVFETDFISIPNSYMNTLSVEEFERLNKLQMRQLRMLTDAVMGKLRKSDCCHAEVTTYAMKDVCSFCLEQCELET